MEEKVKTVTKHYCGKCKEELKATGGLDFLGFLAPQQRYCPNQKCERYGVVTVASIQQEETV